MRGPDKEGDLPPDWQKDYPLPDSIEDGTLRTFAQSLSALGKLELARAIIDWNLQQYGFSEKDRETAVNNIVPPDPTLVAELDNLSKPRRPNIHLSPDSAHTDQHLWRGNIVRFPKRRK